MAEDLDVAVADDGQAVGARQLHQGIGVHAQRLAQRAVRRKPPDQFVFHAAQADAFAIKLGVALGLQLARQIAGQGRAADPQLVGQQLGRGVVTGDQAPQRVIDDDRHRGRGPHVHVPEILQVDRRHRAQAAVAHVQRRLAGRHGTQGLGRIAAVGNDPHGVAQIKGARLSGDVGGREMVVQERASSVRTSLGDHLARVVVVEAVDHDPVEPGQLAKGLGRPFAHRLHRHRPFQRCARSVQIGDQVDSQARLLRALFDLDDHQVVGGAGVGRTVDDHVVFQAIGRAPAAGESGLLHRRHRADAPVRDIAQHVGDGAIDPGLAAGQILDGARALSDRQRLQVQNQQKAVRLDGLRNMDRLAITVRQHRFDAVRGLGHAAASCVCVCGCRVR